MTTATNLPNNTVSLQTQSSTSSTKQIHNQVPYKPQAKIVADPSSMIVTNQINNT
jgi:hypothetical protein